VKSVRGGRTTTNLARLDDGGREEEIARMIAGARISAQVLASARDLLATRRPSEQTAKQRSPEARMKARGQRDAS